ncbi:MAG: ArnT family glycosyltransferase [Tepidimonas sp.]|uniref:ArnT family glycosyltransferase n=1 Tax=Tepidimonas sp. TaxID=2002775 RepID=UPI004054BFBB
MVHRAVYPASSDLTPEPWRWWLLWIAVLATTLFGRQLLPIDETRYAAVAWEMWRDQHWLYPTLDGAFYAQKPPLLFWLTLIGWAWLGVADWIPRAVAAAMGIAAMVATVALTRRLWPQAPEAARWVPAAFGLSLMWLLFAPAWYFDIPNALWCVLGVHGLLDLGARRWGRGAALLALAFVAGVFTKGPMVLLTVGAAAASGSVWGPRWAGWRAPSLVRAAVVVAATALLSLAVYAAWLLWVSEHAGVAAWRDVLGAQAVDRLSDDADHALPVWWYAPQLLWILWPAWVVALALRNARAALQGDAGTRLTWLTGALLLSVLSMAAGKRAHYLMGWIPLGAAWLAWRLSQADLNRRPALGWRLLVALPALGVGVALVVAVGLPAVAMYPWADPSLQGVGAALVLWSAAVAWPARSTAQWVRRLAMGGVFLMLLHVAIARATGPSFQLRSLAERVGDAMRAGHPVAWTAGRFHGVLTFYGRLPRSPEMVDADAADAWLARHPTGWVLYSVRTGGDPNRDDCTPYRSGWLCVRQAPSR